MILLYFFIILLSNDGVKLIFVWYTNTQRYKIGQLVKEEWMKKKEKKRL